MNVAAEQVDLENVIVVGVDGSEHATAAVEWAADAAERRGADLRLVCAWMPQIETMSGGRLPQQSFYDAQLLWADAVLREESVRVVAGHPNVALSTSLCRESPLRALREESAHALMTVVGAQGSEAITGMLLGSVTQRLVPHAAGPVVVVHGPGSSSTAGPVVVGLDGSPSSDDALAFAFEEASFRGVPLVAIRVWDGTVGDDALLPHFTIQDLAEIGAAEQRGLAEQLTGWSEKYPDVEVQQHLLRGKPAAALLEFCTSRDGLPTAPALIVVGSRGRGGLLGMLLGSTSHALTTHADAPVCVVHRCFR